METHTNSVNVINNDIVYLKNDGFQRNTSIKSISILKSHFSTNIISLNRVKFFFTAAAAKNYH